MDWLGGLASGLQLADLSAALHLAESRDERDRAIARAAVRLIAAATCAAADDLPETARRWLSRQNTAHPMEPLRHEAIEATKLLGDTGLARLLQSLPSEEVK